MADNNEKTVNTPDQAETVEAVADEAVADEAVAQEVTEDKQKAEKPDKKKTKKLEEELQKKEEELIEANDKYTRLFAEYDNFRKRTVKEKEGIYADAYLDALTQILPVLDNLERAAAYESSDAQTLCKGLELTLKSFSETLEKMGVKEIEALGKPFDPNLHNAVMHVDDDSFGEGEVVEVFAKGYTRGDKVLRFAMVKVAN